MESGGFPGLQNQCDLTMSGRVGSIPIHSRHNNCFVYGRRSTKSGERFKSEGKRCNIAGERSNSEGERS